MASQRAFSSPEALAYELTIAPALARALQPTVSDRIVGGRAVDIGCGGGRLAEAITGHPADFVVGLDPSRSQAQRFSRRRGNPNAGLIVQGRAEELPFGDDSFDSLYSSCAWKHWPDPSLGAAECARVTRPSGSIVIIEIDGTSTSEDFWKFASLSGVPPGMKAAYVRFAMRSVVGVAPTIHELADSFASQPMRIQDLFRLEDLPFLALVGIAE